MKRTFALLFLLACLVQARASELFIRISSPGTFEVTVADQYQKNSTGKFRFFDLNSGYVSIHVKQSGSYTTYYQGSVNLRSGNRMVVEIGQNDLYQFSNASCSSNYDFPSGGRPQSSGQQHSQNNYSNNYRNNGCDENTFNEMYEMIKEKLFDSQKVEKAKTFAAKANFTSMQVKRICELMDYDSNKLEFAKYAYEYVVDKGSYFVVENAFTYKSSKDELEEYISKH